MDVCLLPRGVSQPRTSLEAPSRIRFRRLPKYFEQTKFLPPCYIRIEGRKGPTVLLKVSTDTSASMAMVYPMKVRYPFRVGNPLNNQTRAAKMEVLQPPLRTRSKGVPDPEHAVLSVLARPGHPILTRNEICRELDSFLPAMIDSCLSRLSPLGFVEKCYSPGYSIGFRTSGIYNIR